LYSRRTDNGFGVIVGMIGNGGEGVGRTNGGKLLTDE